MSKKLTKDELLKEYFKADDTVTVNARALQQILQECLQKDLTIDALRKKIVDLKADLSIKDVTIQRLKLESMQNAGSFTLDLSA